MKIKYEWIFLEINGTIIYTFYTPLKLHCKFWVHGFPNFHTKCSHEKVDLSPPDPYVNTDLAVYTENYLY